MKKFTTIIKFIYIFISFFIISYLLIISYLKRPFYYAKLLEKSNMFTYSISAPRGNIYDKNGVLLVGNKITNNIVYHYTKKANIKSVSASLAKILKSLPSDNEFILYYKDYYDEESLLTDNELKLIKERKISISDKKNLINKRILELKNTFSEKELYEAKIYGTIVSGSLYESKLIASDVPDEIIMEVLNLNIKGLEIEKGYKRYYPYENTLKDILGSVKKISKENKLEYLSLGYDLNDEVGISGLEKQYDKYLKGQKALYNVDSNYQRTLIKEEKKGSDLYLSIDINMQLKLDEILEKNITKAKKYPVSSFLSDSYAIVSDPNTSEILAISGKRLLKDGVFNDVAINNLTSSFVMGSVIKGATISVGYKYNLIDPLKMVQDSCVSLKNQNPKCSWTNLGSLNAISALKQSSNYYQFLIAIGLTGKNYTPGMQLDASEKHFAIYRSMLASYGLGELSNIDHPSEKPGIKGTKIADDLLLNLSIGQYDTYTPISLLTYINTIASSGAKRSPSFVSYIKKDDKIIYENEHKIIGHADVSSDNLKYIQKGFYEVMQSGTGSGFMNHKYNAAGKTGTAETFIDTNDDGIIDTPVLNLTMAAYFPYDNPKYSFVIVSPYSNYISQNQNIYFLNAYISHDLSNFLFENM